MAKQPTKKVAKKATKKAVKKVAAKKVVVKKAAAKKVAVKKTVVKKVAAKAPAKKAVVKKAVVKKVAAKKVPAKKATKKAAKKTVTTTIIAKCDVGFGNSLSIRGGAAGLSWETGAAMENTQADEWVWTSTKVTNALAFKVLANDETWNDGDDLVVFPGATVVFEPTFS